jgi:hypothetical protein
MNEKTNKNLVIFLGAYPRRPKDLESTSEYQQLIVERIKPLKEEYAPLYAAVEMVDKKLKQKRVSSTSAKKYLDWSFEREFEEIAGKCRKDAAIEYAAKDFSELVNLLETSKPLSHCREIKQYKWTEHCACGDADTGYERWDEERYANYFLQMQRLRLGDQDYLAAITGDMNPTLRIRGFSLAIIDGWETREVCTSPHENLVLNLQTRIDKIDFLEGRAIINESDIGVELVQEKFRNMTPQIKRFVRLVNRNYGKIPNGITEESRIENN